MMRIYHKNIGFIGHFFWKDKFLYSRSEKYKCITWSLKSKSKMTPIVRYFWKFYANPKYRQLYKVAFCFRVCCIFCITTLCFLKIWCAFGSFMQSIFSRIEYSIKIKFFSLTKLGVQHLKLVKPCLICTKYWFGGNVFLEKTFFFYFCF